MDFGLVLGLLKVSIETFNNERKDRILKQYVKLEKEWYEEFNQPENRRSDLALDRIMLELEQLAKLVVAENSNK